jgi:hypothetical protein
MLLETISEAIDLGISDVDTSMLPRKATLCQYLFGQRVVASMGSDQLLVQALSSATVASALLERTLSSRTIYQDKFRPSCGGHYQTAPRPSLLKAIIDCSRMNQILTPFVFHVSRA